jgi:hypothetical protein
MEPNGASVQTAPALPARSADWAPSDRRRIRFNRVRALWAPIIMLELYLAFTVYTFLFGPVDWFVPNPAKLLLFLAINYGALWFGYSRGIRPAVSAVKRSAPGQVGVIRMHRWVLLLLLGSLLFNIVVTIARLYAIKGSVSGVLEAFRSPGLAYSESQLMAQFFRAGEIERFEIAQFSWIYRTSTLFAVFHTIYFPLGLACWRWMNVGFRALYLVSLVCTLVFTVAVGAQSGIGYLVFALLPVALYRIYVSSTTISAIRPTPKIRRTGEKRLSPTAIKGLIALAFAILVVTVTLFQVDRAETSGRAFDAVAALAGPHGEPSDDGFLVPTGGRINYGVTMGLMYLSHGYEGLALAMELPFQWTYGLGWSRAVQVIVMDYMGGPDLFDRTYLARNDLKNDWPALHWWSTIFAWMASDTTFYGTAFVMMFVGFVIARFWSAAIITGNPVAFAVLAQLFILVFMFPANNALAQSLNGFFALVGVIVIYRMSRKYFPPVYSFTADR